MRIPLLGGSYKGISTNTSSQECINFFYEAPAPGESHLGAALPVHGTSLFATAPNGGPIRSLLYNSNDVLLYIISDDDFYELTSGGTFTARGTLSSTGSSTRPMALNPATQDIVMVDGVEGRTFNCTTNVFATITDADFPDTANQVIFLNGRFIVNTTAFPGRFYYSDLNSATSWDSASFATAESVTSSIKGLLEHNGVIYILGDTNGELWYNSGTATATYSRFERINYGITNGNCLKRFDNSVIWLARNEQGELHVVTMGQGYTPQILSTPELTRTWGTFASVGDVTAYTYQMDGHEFYVLTFPSASQTYVYDATTKMWHQRSGPFSGGNPIREQINTGTFCPGWGGHIVGLYNSGALLSFENAVFTFNSVNMERRLTGPLLSANNEAQLRFSEVQVDIEEGIADAGDAGNDDELTFSYSKDGGHTYSVGTQLLLGVGATTGYANRLMKRKLGKGRLWNFRVYTDTPRKIIVKGAYGRVYGEDKLGPRSAPTK